MLRLDSKIASTLTDQDDKVFVGEIGKTISIYSDIDLTGATSVKMIVKKPNNAEVEWTASIDTNPYYATYDLVEDDIDLEGQYYLSLEVIINSKTLKGETAVFNAYNQFEDSSFLPPH